MMNFAVGGSTRLHSLAKFGSLPHLAFVLAQILHDKGCHVLDRKEPLPSRVDRKTAEITGHPATTKPFSDHGCRARTDEAVQDKLSRLR